jgi:hypothetical protein
MVPPKAASTGARWARVLLPALAFVGALCVALALQGASPADAAKAKQIGKTPDTPNPLCPRSCSAIASVTGFQTAASGKKHPYRIREDGHIVAWSVDLGKPDKEAKEFFSENFKTNEFGGNPSARLAIVKPKGKAEYKLKSQSTAVALQSEYGRTPLFTLNDPLRVKEDDVVALTVPTWSPSFYASPSRREDEWRGSRSPKRCSDSLSDARASRPHEEVGSTRRYGCKFDTARLLYWAYFVPSRRSGGGGNDGGGNDGGGNDGGGNNR